MLCLKQLSFVCYDASSFLCETYLYFVLVHTPLCRTFIFYFEVAHHSPGSLSGVPTTIDFTFPTVKCLAVEENLLMVGTLILP